MKRPAFVYRLAALLLSMLVTTPRLIVASQAWDAGTALLLEPGQKEVGVFNPLRIGFAGGIELDVHPFFFFAFPHMTVKKEWYKTGAIVVSTGHSLRYPTLLIQNISREGTGGILPADTEPNRMVTFGNELYSTFRFSGSMLTLKMRYDRTLGAEKDHIPTIDFALAYPRTASLSTGQLMVFGADLDGVIAGRFSYTMDVDYFYFPPLEDDYAVESKLLLHCQLGETVRIVTGVKSVFGAYPFGKERRFLPLLDVIFRW